MELDPNREAVATLGAKEGLAHLALAMLSPGDVVLRPILPIPFIQRRQPLPGPTSSHSRGQGGIFEDLLFAMEQTWPQPKLLIIKLPA